MSNQNDWKEVFRNKLIAPIVIGFILACVGMFTPYEYEIGFVALGMIIIGCYFWCWETW